MAQALRNERAKVAAADLAKILLDKEFSEELQTAHRTLAQWRHVHLLIGGAIGVKHSLNGKMFTSKVFSRTTFGRTGTLLAALVMADVLTYRFQPWRKRAAGVVSPDALYNFDESTAREFSEEPEIELCLGRIEDALVQAKDIETREEATIYVEAKAAGKLPVNRPSARKDMQAAMSRFEQLFKAQEERLIRLERNLSSLRGDMANLKTLFIEQTQRLLEALDAFSLGSGFVPIRIAPLPALPAQGPSDWPPSPVITGSPVDEPPPSVTGSPINEPLPSVTGVVPIPSSPTDWRG